MRTVKWYPYIFFIIFAFFICNISKTTSQKARFFCIGSLCPSWEICHFLKEKTLLAFSSYSRPSLITEQSWKELEALKRENQVLQMQLENINEWFLHEDRIEEQIHRLQEVQQEKVEGDVHFFYARRQQQIMNILKLQLKALPAKVVYREPCSWSSFVWVNVGENQNKALRSIAVGKNSPVVVGNTLIGFVEEVGSCRSKVRLLTDSKLVPAVRAVRGSQQNYVIVRQIEALLQALQTRQELFASEQESKDLFSELQKISFRTGYFAENFYLAKGELCGSSLPLWRSRGQVLQGVGFNYDFPDEEGPARDLRTGESLSEKHGKKVSLLRTGDLLITTGLDGVFPPGFEVAIVTEVHSLQEGSSSYEIKAKALVQDFNEIYTVFILPPLDREI